MKFTIVVVMLALALGSEASIFSWANGLWNHHDTHEGAVHADHSGWNDGHHDSWSSHGPVNTHGISLKQGSGWNGHHEAAPAHYNHAPAQYDHHHHDAHYVAKTLGAVHTAPLPGHVESVKSFNVAPAAAHHDHHSAPAHYSGHYAHAPAHYEDHYAHAPAHYDHHHDSHYVAKTLGAVHTAPLPGHVDSVKSFNVAPAPGTHH